MGFSPRFCFVSLFPPIHRASKSFRNTQNYQLIPKALPLIMESLNQTPPVDTPNVYHVVLKSTAHFKFRFLSSFKQLKASEDSHSTCVAHPTPPASSASSSHPTSFRSSACEPVTAPPASMLTPAQLLPSLQLYRPHVFCPVHFLSHTPPPSYKSQTL